MKPRWVPIDEKLRLRTDHNSGAYAIRDRKTKRVAYVGESHRGRLWKTLLRHFQAPESFRKVRETGVFASSTEKYEAAVWVTSKGAKPRGTPADQKAMKAQASWIATLDPTRNKDDGLTYDLPGEDDDPWGGLIANPSFPKSAGPWFDVRMETKAQAKKLAAFIVKSRGYQAVAEDFVVTTNTDHRDVTRCLIETKTMGTIREREDNPSKKKTPAQKEREAKWAALWKDPEYLRLQAVKDAALKHEARAESDWLATKIASYRVEWEASKPKAKAALDAMTAYEERWFSGKPNPAPAGRPAELVELGKLTKITWGKSGVRTFPLASAPSLVYDAKGKLSIVYAAALTPLRPSLQSVASYVRKHWGSLPSSASLSEGEVASGPWRQLGSGVSIVYTTKKDDAKPVDYVHKWGETTSGVEKGFRAPVIKEHRCSVSRCPCEGRLAIEGGTYRVTDHGIVG